MALQDLTPQLRTRLSRMERAVGLFVALAMGLLIFGFAYYIYNTAKRKGWFLTKAPYYTFTERATGLRVGDPVMLMGFPAGRITSIEPMPAEQFIYNVYIQFELTWPNYDYMWTEGSHAKVATADFLGKRSLEVTKGTGGYPTYVSYPLREIALSNLETLPERAKWLLGQEVYDASGTRLMLSALVPLTNLAALSGTSSKTLTVLDSREKRKGLTGLWDYQQGRYLPFDKKSKGLWLLNEESPALTDRLEQLVTQVEEALPNILGLTNQLGQLLSNGANLSSNLSVVAQDARPAVSNLVVLTAGLNHPGALGELLLPTNINYRLDETLGSANSVLTNAVTTLSIANTNVATLAESLNESLKNLASMTSNLNTQVEANTNILSAISKTIVDADHFIQGLKRHWLLRSAFREKKSPTPPSESRPLRAPKDPRREPSRPK